MTGDKPINERVHFATALSLLAAQDSVLFVISNRLDVTPPFAAMAVLVNASQLPPTCSILEPIFCCISFADSDRNLAASAWLLDTPFRALVAASQLFVASSVLFITASSRGLIACIPDVSNKFLRVAVFSACDISLVFSATSVRICLNGFMFPAASVKDRPSRCISFAPFLVGAAILSIAWLRSCDACAALIPVFVIRPMAAEASVILTPSNLDELATFESPCCIVSMDALEMLAFCVKIAAACSLEPIESPQTFIACWTTPAVVVKSAPAAVAACAMAGNCVLILLRSAPFCAISIMACAASLAEIGNSAPMRFATSASSLIFLDVPPATTAALFRFIWNSPKPFAAETPMAVVPSPMPVIALPATESPLVILSIVELLLFKSESNRDSASFIPLENCVTLAFSTASTSYAINYPLSLDILIHQAVNIRQRAVFTPHVFVAKSRRKLSFVIEKVVKTFIHRSDAPSRTFCALDYLIIPSLHSRLISCIGHADAVSFGVNPKRF